MKQFMWSWKKFIVGVAVDNLLLPSLNQRIEGLKHYRVIAIHLGFLTIVFDSRT